VVESSKSIGRPSQINFNPESGYVNQTIGSPFFLQIVFFSQGTKGGPTYTCAVSSTFDPKQAVMCGSWGSTFPLAPPTRVVWWMADLFNHHKSEISLFDIKRKKIAFFYYGIAIFMRNGINTWFLLLCDYVSWLPHSRSSRSFLGTLGLWDRGQAKLDRTLALGKIRSRLLFLSGHRLWILVASLGMKWLTSYLYGVLDVADSCFKAGWSEAPFLSAKV